MDVIKEKKTSVGLKQVAERVNMFSSSLSSVEQRSCINTVSLPSFYTDRLLLLNTVALYDNIFSYNSKVKISQYFIHPEGNCAAVAVQSMNKI